MNEQLEALRAAVKTLPIERDRNFAADLVAGFEKYGRWTPGQAPWVQRLIDRANSVTASAENLGNLTPLLALFKGAQGQFPKLFLPAQGEMPTIKLAIAGERSKYHGSVMVAEDGKFGQAKWYGRIAPDGTWQPGKDAAPPELLPLLRALAADPARVAGEQGRMSGQCCFCGDELTDERSTTVGYGPHCAKRWNMPWGNRAGNYRADDLGV